MDLVERVEELLLEFLGALEELDVVDEQYVEVAVATLEQRHAGAIPDGLDEVVHKRLRREVAHSEFREQRTDVMSDRVQQVRLAEPRASIDEQRVVGLGRLFGDGERGGVREAVRRAD